MTRMTGPDCAVMYKLINTHTHTHIPPCEDRCEGHRMTRITGPDCAVMCNIINTHTHTHMNQNEQRKHNCSEVLIAALLVLILIVCHETKAPVSSFW